MSLEPLAFGRGGHIVLAFLTQEVCAHVVEGSRKLHVISLDAASGRIVANRTWPAQGPPSDKAYVGTTNDGNFIVLRGGGLCVYSPDLKK